jgi:TP901 family phage tail tape measure protein
MASLTGMAFQIDFLLGRGSRQKALSGIRDTVDQINLISKQGANKASADRRKKLEKDLKDLDTQSKKSADRLIKGREAAGKSAAAAVGKTASTMTRKAKTDTSGLDTIGKKVKTVAQQMKGSFRSLNAELKARGKDALATGGFASQKTLMSFTKQEKADREEIVAIMQRDVDLKRKAGTLTKGDELALQTIKNLHKEVLALEGQDLATRKKLGELSAKYLKDFTQAEKQEIRHLKESMALRQQAGQQIDNMTESVGSGLRNAFIYSTAAVAAFYYKLNDVLTTFRDFENEMINAQSIFQTTNEELYDLSDQIAKFGLSYGIELQNAATGLYQLASAGLSADQSMQLLNNTLKLSMAVQGDHNTISKLTTQTIFGFGLEMNQSAEITDKFAHAINKSLIEYQDLASAVKFAMPFFVATGQTLDQLLGSLQVLTNRALEAGIAGRGLRQALAEFAESAEDNTRAFRKMGIEIVNADGNFKQLTEIARDFHDTFGEAATDVELMTTLLEDLNVRGATAFIHLVQNVDEFEGAVNDLQNSAGSAAKMAEIQQKSLNNQIQILKNALMAPFLIADEIKRTDGYINDFHATLHKMIGTFSDMIYETMPDGTKVLTEMGQGMREFVITAFQQLTILVYNAAQVFKSMAKNTDMLIGMFNLILIPLKVVLGLLTKLGPTGMQFVMVFKLMNTLLPLSTLMLNAQVLAELRSMQAMQLSTAERWLKTKAILTEVAARIALYAGMSLLVWATMQEAKGNHFAATSFAILGGAIMGVAVAYQALKAAGRGPVAFAIAAAAGAIIGLAYVKFMGKMMKTPDMPPLEEFDLSGAGAGGDIAGVISADTGMRVPMSYDTGGSPGRRTINVEAGETITSKTMNALGGGASGITINIEGDVYDGDNFADKIAESLPRAINQAGERGIANFRMGRGGIYDV